MIKMRFNLYSEQKDTFMHLKAKRATLKNTEKMQMLIIVSIPTKGNLKKIYSITPKSLDIHLVFF